MPVESYWRRAARRVIVDVLDAWNALPDDERTEQSLRRMLRAAYPFGERENHPYDMWRKEQQTARYEAGFGPRPRHLTQQPRPHPIPDEQLPLIANERRTP